MLTPSWISLYRLDSAKFVNFLTCFLIQLKNIKLPRGYYETYVSTLFIFIIITPTLILPGARKGGRVGIDAGNSLTAVVDGR